MEWHPTQLLCPYCRTLIASGAKVTFCTSCGLPYHTECWQENRGCAAYGCPEHATDRGQEQIPPEEPDDQSDQLMTVWERIPSVVRSGFLIIAIACAVMFLIYFIRNAVPLRIIS